MAPYVMTVLVVNQTDDRVRWVGASTLSELDGETSVDSLSVAAQSEARIAVTKRGGKHGLFTALTWGVGSAEPRVLVWARMSAAKEAVAQVRLRDVYGLSAKQMRGSSTADYCEANNGSRVLVDSFEYQDYKVRACLLGTRLCSD
jgi:hypothetical protein